MRVLLITLVAACLLSPALAPAAESRPQGVTLYGQTLLQLINEYRQQEGLATLRFDPKLVQLAKEHSFTMSRQKRLSHLNFQERFQRSGRRICVENVGWNHTYPPKQFRAWQDSPGHNQNMLIEELQIAGIAEIDNYVTFFACQ